MGSPTRSRFQNPLPLSGLVASAVLAGIGSGQSIAGSESSTSLARDTVASGGSGVGTGGSLEFALPAAAGPIASSETYRLVPTVIWTEPVLGTDAPVVFGSTPPLGAAAGGEPITLQGLNFSAIGAGVTEVTFGGSPAAAVTVLGPTTVAVTTPVGTDPSGNPLGGVDLTVTNDLGASTVDDPFLFTPAVFALAPATLGHPFSIRMRTAPGSFAFLWFGVGVDGAPPIPIPGLDGAVALVLAPTFAASGAFLADGELAVSLAVPDQPSLAGAVIDFQGLAITDPFGTAGSFTNVLDVPITH